jgi:O-antigen/teichoic acid export membrane protein
MSLIARNLSWMIIGNIASWGVSVMLLIVAPRSLGDVALGQVSFAFVYVSLFELVAMLGSATFVVKTVARDHKAFGPYVFNTLAMKLVFAPALAAVAVGLALLLRFDQTVTIVIAIYCVNMVVGVVIDAVVAGLQGIERIAGPAMWAVVRSYAGAIFAIAALTMGAGIVGYALAITVAGLIPLVAAFVYAWPHLRGQHHIDLRLWKVIAVGGIPFLSWSALLLVYGKIDIPILEALAGSETVGWYSLAYQWVSMPAFFASVVTTAFLPQLSAHGVQLTPRFVEMANNALRLVVFVGIPSAIGIALISSDLIGLLYNGQFEQAVPVMWVLSLHIPLVGIDMVLALTLIATDRQKQWLYIGLAAAIVNPLLNLAVIPLAVNAFDNGAIGAAAVTVATEALMMAGALWLRPRGVLDSPTFSFAVRTTGAALVMALAVLAVGSTSIVVEVVVGVVAYALAALAFRVITKPMLRMVADKLPGVMRRPGSVPTPMSAE